MHANTISRAREMGPACSAGRWGAACAAAAALAAVAVSFTKNFRILTIKLT